MRVQDGLENSILVDPDMKIFNFRKSKSIMTSKSYEIRTFRERVELELKCISRFRKIPNFEIYWDFKLKLRTITNFMLD